MSFIKQGRHGTIDPCRSVKGGGGMQPHHQQAGPKIPSSLNVPQENGDLKSTCTLYSVVVSFMLLWSKPQKCVEKLWSELVCRKSKRIVRARTGTRTNYALIIINLPPRLPISVYTHVNKYAYIPANINIVATFLFQTYRERERRVNVRDLTEWIATCCLYCWYFWRGMDTSRTDCIDIDIQIRFLYLTLRGFIHKFWYILYVRRIGWDTMLPALFKIIWPDWKKSVAIKNCF